MKTARPNGSGDDPSSRRLNGSSRLVHTDLHAGVHSVHTIYDPDLHAEHAEALAVPIPGGQPPAVCGGASALPGCQSQREADRISGVCRFNNAVIPQACSGIIRRGLLLDLVL